MKTLFILSGFMTVVLCLKDEHEAKLKKWHMECMKETKVKPELIPKLSAGNWQINNKLLKKWTHCMLIKYDIMTEQGVFKMDSALSLVASRDQAMIEDVIDDCLPQSGTVPYEIAYEYARCYHNKIRDPLNKTKRLHYLTLFY